VQTKDVNLLNARGVGVRHADVHIVRAQQLAHGPAVLPGKRDDAPEASDEPDETVEDDDIPY